MLEPMTVQVEVWPVAADDAGLWLISGSDALRSGAVMADGEPHDEVESLLYQYGLDCDSAMLHSTSWRVHGPSVILTYMAVIRADDFVCGIWPDAQPITADLATAVGKPLTHAPNEPPTPRFVDVLLHGLRHLRYLMQHDVTNAAAMGDLWRRHLEPLEPALATMYDVQHEAVG